MAARTGNRGQQPFYFRNVGLEKGWYGLKILEKLGKLIYLMLSGGVSEPASDVHRQRNSFMASTKQTTTQPVNVPSCGASCASVAPCSMCARSASITAVSGSS